MRTTLIALFLTALASIAVAQDVQPLAVTTVSLGENEQGEIVTRVTFRFAPPDEYDLLLQGSFMHDGKVLRNFRYAVPPAASGSVTAIQPFPAGESVIDVRLIMPLEKGAPVIIARVTETVTLEATGRPYVADVDDGAEAVLAEGIVPESVGAVKIRTPRRDVAPNLFVVEVDVAPPVQRVEFWVDGRRVIARNAPPYRAELDLGRIPKRVEVRAVGYDRQGRYVDADAFVVNERQTPLEVKITRTETPDGLTRIRLSVQNPQNSALRSVVLYAGERKLQEWIRPPYALDLPTSSLAGAEFLRASALDETGYEASDLLFLSGDRFVEQIDVSVVELPVSVTTSSGSPLTGLEAGNFTILENGKVQKVSSFNFAANLPISVGVLLDHSGSMEKRMADAQNAAVDFFKSIIRKGDRAFFAGFAGDPARSAPFVSDVAALEAQVRGLPEARGGTALYDAIITGLYRFRNVQGRKALIVITDGQDTTSRLSYDEMLGYARAARVPLYFIGIGFSPLDRGGVGRMRSLAAETGGVVHLIRGTSELPTTYKALESDLRTQYLLTYRAQTSKEDQAYRTIEVKVDRPDARARTIRGYIP
jgi:Ca-activated chloride channel homolog